MQFRKLLGIISIIIVVMFGLMLTTSYAWYSFSEGSTTFSAVTNNDDVIVSFQRGEYISTSIAVPIKSTDIDKYSDKNNFTIRVKDNQKDNEMLVTVSLVDVSISEELKDVDFKIDLYHQSKSVANISGDMINVGEDATNVLGNVTLDDNVDNNFELRVYILDDNTDQSLMMNKTFQAKIKVDVVSRIKTTMTDYNNSDIYISSIIVDGEESKVIPTKGYYNMNANCIKGSKLTWEPLSRIITYNRESYVADSCSLTFTSSTDYPLLSEMPVGSYVKYTGNNGCDGKHCEGVNANYINDSKMGYCNNLNYQFITNGWRIGYIEDGNVYLVSAGAVECVNNTYKDLDNEYISKLNNITLKYCNVNYIKDGVCNDKTSWLFSNLDFEKITNNKLDNTSCYNKYSDKLCGYTNDLIDNGGDYLITSPIDADNKELFYWEAKNRYINSTNINIAYGVRPVLSMDSSVVVTGGEGTKSNPYIISNSK